MATTTWEPISTYTASSTQSTITFNSIPQTYKNLVLRGTVQVTNGGSSYLTVRFNNSSGTTYDSIQFYGAGGNTGVSGGCYNAMSSTSFEIVGNQFQSYIHFPIEIELNNYTVSNKYKTALLSARPGDNTSRYLVGQFRDTTAVSRIDIICSAASIATGSTFTLWGLA